MSDLITPVSRGGAVAKASHDHDLVAGGPSKVELTFDAFISYRRQDGKELAEWLYNRLRRYRLPRRLRKLLPAGARGRDERPLAVFRDERHEGADEDFWGSFVVPNLCKARHLVVLSTPAAFAPRADGQPNWLWREIEEFLSLKRGDPRRRISLCLGPDAPEDRYPGRLNEPLADEPGERPRWNWVDLRSFGGRRRWLSFRSKLDEPFSKLVATLLDVPAELVPVLRREEEQRRARRLAAAGMIGVLIMAAMASALQFFRQSYREQSDRLAAEAQVLTRSGSTDEGLARALEAVGARQWAFDDPEATPAGAALAEAFSHFNGRQIFESAEGHPAYSEGGGNSNSVRQAVASNDGQHILTIGTFDHQVHLWSVESGTEIPLVDQRGAAAAFHPDGRRFVVCPILEPCRLSNIAEPASPLLLGEGRGQYGFSTAFEAKGELLLIGERTEEWELWDLRDFPPSQIVVPQCSETLCEHVAVSPDGRYIATSSSIQTYVEEEASPALDSPPESVNIPTSVEDELPPFPVQVEPWVVTVKILDLQTETVIHHFTVPSNGDPTLRFLDPDHLLIVDYIFEISTGTGTLLAEGPEEVSVAPDGSLAVVWSESNQVSVRLLPQNTAVDPGPYDFQKEISLVAWPSSGEARMIAIGGGQQVRLLQVMPDHQIVGHELRLGAELELSNASAVFSPDSSRLLVQLSYTEFELWDLEEKKKLASVSGACSPPDSRIFSDNSSYFVLLDCDTDALLIFDAGTGNIDVRLGGGHPGQAGGGFQAEQAFFLPNSESVVVIPSEWSSPSRAFVWNARRRAIQMHLDGHPFPVTQAKFIDNERAILTTARDQQQRYGITAQISAYDLSSGRKVVWMEEVDKVVVAASSDQHVLATLSAKSGVSAGIWESKDGVLTSQPFPELRDLLFRTLTLSPSGRYLVAHWSYDTPPVWMPDHWAALVDIAERRIIGGIDGGDEVIFGPGERSFVAFTRLYQDTLAHLYATQEARLVATIPDQGDLPVAFSPDGSSLAVGTADGEVRLVDTVTGETHSSFRPRDVAISALTWDRHNDLVFSGAEDGSIDVCRVDGTSGCQVYEVFSSDENRAVRDLRVSRDGGLLIAALSDGTARVWEVATRRNIAVLKGHEDAVLTADFDRAARRAITGSADRTARVWTFEAWSTFDELLALARKQVEELSQKST